jgi:hypothetical protein
MKLKSFDVTHLNNTIDQILDHANKTIHLTSAKPSLWQRFLAVSVILAGLVCTVGGVWINLVDRNGSSTSSMPTRQLRQVEFYQEFDHSLEMAKDHSHGVFIRFLKFNGDYLSQLALNAYFRAVYDLYPMPVRVGYSDVAMNTAPQMMETNSKPDDEWMRNHGLDAELTINPPPLLNMQLRPLDGQPIINLPVVTFRPLVLPPSSKIR